MNLIDWLHKLNSWIIESVNFYNINYIIAILVSFYFIWVLYRDWIKTLKRVVKHDKLYLRGVIWVVIVDMILSTFFFFYEIFYNRDIFAGLTLIRVTIFVLLASWWWIIISYNMLYSSKKNPYIWMQTYLPMLSLLGMVYISHIHIYSMLDNTVSKYVIFFWEIRAVFTIFASFTRSIVTFTKSVLSSTEELIKKADTLEDDLEVLFNKKNK